MIEAVIFDLDGTIIDSIEDVAECLKRAYQTADIPFNIQNVKSIMGPPLREIILNISPDIGEERIRQIITYFRDYYDNNEYKRTKLIDGIKELLDTLSILDKRIYIATIKVKLPTNKIIRKLGIEKYFDDVISVDSVDGKKLDKAEMIKILIDRHGLNREAVLFVGDTISDVEAAKKNRIRSAAFLNGYGDRDSLHRSGPDYAFNKMEDIIGVIQAD